MDSLVDLGFSLLSAVLPWPSSFMRPLSVPFCVGCTEFVWEVAAGRASAALGALRKSPNMSLLDGALTVGVSETCTGQEQS